MSIRKLKILTPNIMKQKVAITGEYSKSPENKTNFEDGFGYLKEIAAYVDLTRKYYKIYPSFYCSRFQLFLESQKYKNIFIQLIGLFLKSKTIIPEFPSSDVLIYCSSRKPNVQPSLDILARRLVRKGIKVAFLTKNAFTHLQKIDKSLKIKKIN